MVPELFLKNMKFFKRTNFMLNTIVNLKLATCNVSGKPILKKIDKYLNNTAVADTNGVYKYRDIIYYSQRLAKNILSFLPHEASPKNIAVMCPNDASFVSSMFGCWITGNTVVPLCKDHPKPQLEYFVKDSQSSLIIVHTSLFEKIKLVAESMNIPCIIHEKMLLPLQGGIVKNIALNSECHKYMESAEDTNAMMIYTSGTTGPPKGVVLTHQNLSAQVSALVEAWQWTPNDVLLHALPLHHLHGILNALLCPLDVGATVSMLPKFNAEDVWDNLLGFQTTNPRVNLFFGVPTMYAKLLNTIEYVLESRNISKEECKEICKGSIRLMTCGSAPLPESLLLRWEEITGQRLLERYGMSEIGMALSNPLNGVRIPGSVGNPLPSVEVAIAKKNSSGYDILVCGDQWKTCKNNGYDGEPGDLLVKGPSVFKQYWNKTEETKKTFTADGWFITGDTAAYQNHAYRILGRTSSEIIKSGGYKISSLDVERLLLANPNIADCTVFGVPDDTWGEKVVAMIVVANKKNISPSQLKEWCKERMPNYLIPSEYKFVREVPRNIMGKINKKQLRSQYTA